MTLALLLFAVGCSTPELAPQAEAPAVAAVQQLTGEALGTTYTVKYLVGEIADDDVAAGVREALASVDAAMSTWRPDSDLSRVRATPGPVVVSEATVEVVEEALSLAEASGGAFDPTVQPLVELWGIHGERRQDVPSAQELAAVMAQVGWERIVVGRDPEGRPTVDAGGTALDLSAIAKGYAVDRVSWALSRLGVANHMVEVGGEVRAHGMGPTGTGWRLGIDRPEEGLAPGAQLEAVVRLTNAALATSGNYRNAYVVDGTRIVHTLDPRVGRPVESGIASATVVAPDCTTADAIATALMVLGEEAGMALIEGRPQVEALLLVLDEGEFRAVKTSGMDAFLVPAGGPPIRVPSREVDDAPLGDDNPIGD